MLKNAAEDNKILCRIYFIKHRNFAVKYDVVFYCKNEYNKIKGREK